MMTYLLSVLFMILAASPSLQQSFVQFTEKPDENNMLFTLCIVGVFSLLYYIVRSNEKCQYCDKENFIFEVTPNRILGRNLPRDAIYASDKSINFEFDRVGSGMCSEGECRTYGLIKGCPDGRSTTSYGEGSTDAYM